ncbi:MAG: amidohydrolase family protein [Phycisphaerales bacterium]
MAAHCNQMDDQAMDALVASGIVVAYCPRASAYFGHSGYQHGQMPARGVTVALEQTACCAWTRCDRISTLDDLRLLMRRDGLDLQQALALATMNGARALGLPEGAFQLKAGERPGGPAGRPAGGAAETGLEAVRAFQTSPGRANLDPWSNFRTLLA